MSTMPTDVDIAIVGGGMVGATLAVALDTTPLRIALIDAAPIAGIQDARLIALTHKSCDLFAKYALWPALLPAAAAIKTIHVSQKGRFGIARLHATDIQRDTLGHVVPASDINAALGRRLVSASRITRLQPARVTALTENAEHVALTLDTQPDPLTATLVIGADGTHSTLRKLLNIPTEIKDTGQKALVTVTHPARHHDHIAYERFHETGALAMLPLTGNRAATIWTDRADLIDALLTETDRSFVSLLQKQMGYRLGRLLSCDTRFSYPLQWMQVKPEHQKKGRVQLIGNAAHTLHPIAAQGLNLALQEVDCLAAHFSNITADHLCLPEKADYFRQQNNGLNLSKKITGIFTTDFLPLNILRQLGIVGLDVSPPLRRQFLRVATGT